MSVPAVAIIRDPLVSEVTRKVFSVMDPEFDSWTRLPGEPEVWFNRFTAYLAMRSFERNILRVYNRERHVENLPPRINLPRDWQLISTAWRWQSRAMAFDQHQSRVMEFDFEQEKKDRKRTHLKAINAFRGVVEEAIDAFDPENDFFRLSEITGALQAIGKEQRAEYNDEPVKKIEANVRTMADLLLASEKELGYGRTGEEPIEAEWRETDN